MINTAKYFALLENLSLEHALANENKKENTTQATSQCLSENLRHLETYVKIDVPHQLEELCIALELTEEWAATVDIENTTNCYIVRLLHVLHTLNSNINFHSDAKEDLISVAHLKLCIQATQELSYYALRSQLHHDFYKSPVFKEAQCNRDPSSQSQSLLLLSIQFFIRFLPVRQLHIANAMELVQRDLLAAIMSLRIQQPPSEQLAQLDAAITYLWDNESKADFFRHVLLLKATPNLCVPLAKELHQQLLSKLSSPHGFSSLVAALQAAAQDLDPTRSSEIVANIVAQRGYSARLQQRLIGQIFDFCRLQLPDVNSLICGVLSLRRLYELNESNRQNIQQILAFNWQPLTEPSDLINGLIIWEQEELSERIRLWQQLFCSSSVACLPSCVLVSYLPLLLQLYQQLPEALPERQSLAALISRCLDNRETLEELPELLRRLFSWQVDGNPPWKSLHQRIFIDVHTNLLTVKVTNADRELASSRALSLLLMSGNNHTLTCKVFLSLLRFMVQELSEPTIVQKSATDLLSTETELAEFLHGKYQLKLELLVALDQLVWHEPLKAQLAETNSKQFIQLVTELLEQRLAGNLEAVDQTLVVILMLLQEILERSEHLQLAESTRRLEQPLQQLASQSVNQLVKNATIPLLSLLSGKANPGQPTGRAFQTARELIEQRQPHLQVYGIQMMLEALRNKDPAFTSQCHRILALALSTLKSKESYTFLNCVRLFVQLVHIMESEVLDMLGDEYLSETAELDYRLVVGEAILKAAQEIGPLCYRYKGVLFNCFLHGARSPLDEFRTSAFANLSQLCRLLAYQVHSFFQELLQLIDAELSTGRYLPAKRGALLVLAELLAGMESLLDYQEMLLPIYRLLRAIEAAESCDCQMRQHAANGLKTLNEKCRQLLSTEPVEQLQHEIKVLGIKEPVATKKRHILELN
ncbi:transport and Golgi organization protein 6 [Drosophila innubila]|uniref:transport and Golgi organization protein 6 n=1 Tax=Drosophila innubila TaxID=198719 RepID=UPI00148CA69D|nr:transport and Golgi organization protein 6 [Drosophila innubila]